MNILKRLYYAFRKDPIKSIKGVDVKYVQAATRTEANYDNFQTRIDNPLYAAFILAFMDQAIKDGWVASDLKRAYMYGKDIPALNDLIEVNSSPYETDDIDRDHPEYVEYMKRLRNPVFMRLFHAALGQYTECLEKFEYLLKYLETGELNRVNAAEEAGDTYWYSAIEASALKIDPALIAQTNIIKLMIRFRDKFTNERASERDLDSELEALRDAFED